MRNDRVKEAVKQFYRLESLKSESERAERRLSELTTGMTAEEVSAYATETTPRMTTGFEQSGMRH